MSKKNKRIAIFIFIVIAMVFIFTQGAKAEVESHNHMPFISKGIYSTPEPVIMPTPDLTPHGQKIVVKISHYDPNLGGVNCASWYDGGCMAHMANGEPWQDYFEENNTIACPFELPFGTRINFGGDSYTCRDRGGAIVITTEGYYWIDILSASVPYEFGELQEAWITYLPERE